MFPVAGSNTSSLPGGVAGQQRSRAAAQGSDSLHSTQQCIISALCCGDTLLCARKLNARCQTSCIWHLALFGHLSQQFQGGHSFCKPAGHPAGAVGDLERKGGDPVR